MMRKDEVRGPVDALVYLMDCQLATVSGVVSKRSSSQYDIKRHISIAQQGIDWMRAYHVNFDGTRAADVVALFNGSVDAWASAQGDQHG